ncbi:MAG: PadR family transcriptional regulator [Synergistaceae bacterium]|jgi:PadR family transcriptional regulator PadR|nr:PadR family transcriptional regulator [Synergistaceae bacterium]
MLENEEIRVWATQIRKGMAELCVLARLRKGEAYGYELLRGMREYPWLSITEGTLYPILNRAAESGWVVLENRPSATGPPRRYYSLTASGARRLENMVAAWQAIGDSVKKLLNDTGEGYE